MIELAENWDNAAVLKNPFVPLAGSPSTTLVRWLVDDYQENKFPHDGIEIIKPTNDLNKNVIDVLRKNGVKRFLELKQYKKGWDFGTGEPMSSQSLAMMETFINLYPQLREKEPSIFLTREGNLQLIWEDNDNNTIEIEFFPDRIEYYLESKEIERTMAISRESVSENLIKFISELEYE